MLVPREQGYPRPQHTSPKSQLAGHSSRLHPAGSELDTSRSAANQLSRRRKYQMGHAPPAVLHTHLGNLTGSDVDLGKVNRRVNHYRGNSKVLQRADLRRNPDTAAALLSPAEPLRVDPSTPCPHCHLETRC